MNFLSLPLAITGIDLGLIMALAGMGTGVLFGVLGMYFHHRRQAMWHETARLALEKGQPVPPLSDSSALADDNGSAATRHQRDRQNDLRGGLVLIGVGAGMYFFFAALGMYSLRYVGAVPGFIGVALLLHFVLVTVFNRKAPPSAGHPPQS